MVYPLMEVLCLANQHQSFFKVLLLKETEQIIFSGSLTRDNYNPFLFQGSFKMDQNISYFMALPLETPTANIITNAFIEGSSFKTL